MDSPAAAPRRVDLLSVVIPIYNEVETVEELHRRVVAALADVPFELVISDNASDDGTVESLERLAAVDERIRVVFLSRNFGHQASLTAGLRHARGNVVVMLDGDLQDPPEVIPEMIDRWRDGYDVVYTVRDSRAGETRLKLATARWFYRLLGNLSELEIPENAGDFRLLDRSALDALLSMPERNRFLRGMSAWIGFSQIAVRYERDARHAGASAYSPRRLVRFSLDAISAFSHRPLQLATALGFLFSVVAFLLIPLAVALRLAGQVVPGITTVLIIVLLLGGIQLITVGIIGEYIGRVYDEVKQRPLYVVRKRLNVAPDAEGAELGPDRPTPAP